MEDTADAEEAPTTPLSPPVSVALVRYSSLRLWGFSCLWLGVSALSASLSVLLVAERVGLMVGEENKSFVMGLVLSLAGLASGIVYPVIGAFSDSHSSRWGRRTPFMFWGTLFMLVSIAVFAVGGHFLLLAPFVIGNVLINIGMSIVSAPFTAIIPDLVSPPQYGIASGFMGVQTLLGYAIGSGVIGLIDGPLIRVFGTSFLPVCILLGVLLALTLAATVVAVKEKPYFHPAEPSTAGAFRRNPLQYTWGKAVAVWIAFRTPFASRDFFWVFWTKFMYTCGIVSTSNFLLYWFQDVFPPPPYSVMGLFELDSPSAATSMFLLPLLLGSTMSSLAAGILSDRFGRKVMVYIAGILQATSATIMVIFPSMNIVILLGLVFGLGHGAFLSVDFALAVDTLPCEKTAAKDLGVWHTAGTLGNVIAPFVAGFLLYYFKEVGKVHFGSPRLGYTVVFSMAAFLFITSALLVSRVKAGGRKPVEEISMEELSATTEASSGSNDLSSVTTTDEEE